MLHLKKIIALLLGGMSVTAYALEESRLWLPVKHQTLYLELKEAALVAESLENCTKVLRGTIDMDQSSKERPIYRILCRMPDGKTYNEMVDGVTKETLTTPVIVEIPLTSEELEAQRIAEEKRAAEELLQKKTTLWQACFSALQQRVGLMINVRHKTTDYVEPVDYSEESSTFLLDFDAEDLDSKHLQYRASCRVRKDENPEVIIRSRRHPKK